MTETFQNNDSIYGEIKRLNSGNTWRCGVCNLHSGSNKLNPWKGVLIENILVPQLVKKFSTPCETRSFLYRTHTRQPPVPVFRYINSAISSPVFLWSIWIISCHLCLGFPIDLPLFLRTVEIWKDIILTLYHVNHSLIKLYICLCLYEGLHYYCLHSISSSILLASRFSVCFWNFY